MGSSKILVLHPDPGGIDAVVATANAQHAKNGPFDAAVFLGTQISEIAPTIASQVPIYFFGVPGGALEDIAPNFTSIRKKWAVVRLASGVTLGFWNEREGKRGEEQQDGKEPEEGNAHGNEGDREEGSGHNEAGDHNEGVDQANNDDKGDHKRTPGQLVDVLFSHHWPYAVAATQQLALVGNREVDREVQERRPRYHFAVGLATGRFYEHSVFEWSGGRTCRFVSLGRQKSGQRWFYAFSIGKEETGVATAPNPFRKRVLEEDKVTHGEEVRDKTETKALEGFQRAQNPSQLAPKRPRVSPETCFFCLSNPRFETHMVVAVGKYSYVATAKGPLPRAHKSLRMAGHAIIIPIAHEPTVAADSDTASEIGRFQKLLAAAFLTQDLATVFYDISRPDNVHYHMQMVPVPIATMETHFSAVLDERVRENDQFERNAPLRFSKYSLNDLRLAEALKGAFVRFTVYTGPEPVYYVAKLMLEKSVDLQFPRRVLAFLLRTPRRVHWEKCRQSVAQETYECERFKEFYHEYDIAKERKEESLDTPGTSGILTEDVK